MWWNEYVGLPYLRYGRDRDGCDCWGLVWLVQKEVFGREFPSFVWEYPDPDDKKCLARALCSHMDEWHPLPPGTEDSGDVVLLLIGGIPCHVGVVTTPGFMLHVSRTINATVESYRTMRWANRVEGVYCHAESR